MAHLQPDPQERGITFGLKQAIVAAVIGIGIAVIVAVSTLQS